MWAICCGLVAAEVGGQNLGLGGVNLLEKRSQVG